MESRAERRRAVVEEAIAHDEALVQGLRDRIKELEQGMSSMASARAVKAIKLARAWKTIPNANLQGARLCLNAPDSSMESEIREHVANMAKVNKPSDATWAVVITLLEQDIV